MSETGIINGPSHEKGGIGIKVAETGEAKEVEGGEYVICSEAVASQKIHHFTNKTNREILDSLHSEYNCDGFDTVLNGAEFIICKLTVGDETPKNVRGTVIQILNQIQAEKGCNIMPKEQYLTETDCHTCDKSMGQGGSVGAKRSLWDEVEKKKQESYPLEVKGEQMAVK
jgi:hypothetical protein